MTLVGLEHPLLSGKQLVPATCKASTAGRRGESGFGQIKTALPDQNLKFTMIKEVRNQPLQVLGTALSA